MDLSRIVEEILLIVCREVLRLAELELKRFTDALEDWVNQLLSQRLPSDWRQRMHAYLDAWDAEFEVAAEDRPILENWIEGWARLRDLLPDDKAPSPAQSAAEFLETAYAQRALTSYFGDRLTLPHMDHLTTDAPEARVTGGREIKGLGAWYDEARRGGYKPWFHTRVAVAVARELLPDSEPTMVITYSDGQTLIVMGGGPTSGAMAGQAGTLASLGIAASKGKLIAELGENAADTAFQEGTGSPIGPSALKRTPPNAQKPARRPKNPDSAPTGAESKTSNPSRRELRFWTKRVEFEGRKVYQRDDLIDIQRTDKKGRSSLDLMKRGRAPVGPDGEPIAIHHVLQLDSGPLAETTMSFHIENGEILHINSNQVPSGIDRTAFKVWKVRYWKARARDFGG